MLAVVYCSSTVTCILLQTKSLFWFHAAAQVQVSNVTYYAFKSIFFLKIDLKSWEQTIAIYQGIFFLSHSVQYSYAFTVFVVLKINKYVLGNPLSLGAV